MKKEKLILFALGFTLIFACTTNTIEEVKNSETDTTTETGTTGTGTTGTGTTGTGTGTTVVNPTYIANIAPIMTASCISCHGVGGTSPTLVTYAQVKAATNTGKLLCRVDTQSCGSVMPPAGRMSQATIDMIKLWKTQGLIN